MRSEIVFDVETKKMFSDVASDDPGLLGVSIVSVLRRVVDDNNEKVSEDLQSYWEKDFDSLWSLFTTADRIIGFNTLKFDIPALRPYTAIDLEKLHHLDIMELVRQKVGRKLSLNALAQETLGNTKIDQGSNAVLYWAKGDPVSLAKLRKYCEADVLLTRDLYDFGKEHGYMKYKDKWNDTIRVEVDFSYPAKKEKSQIGLF
jgi:DEAD/DEAH box helicase domain-containing protein